MNPLLKYEYDKLRKNINETDLSPENQSLDEAMLEMLRFLRGRCNPAQLREVLIQEGFEN